MCADHDGQSQLYAWDVDSNKLERRTFRENGVGGGLLSSDGHRILYHQDEDGQEDGHFVFLPYEGGTPASITPDLPPYSSFGLFKSSNSDQLGFIGAGPDGFSTYSVEIGQEPRLRNHSEHLCIGVALSSDGELLAIGSTARSRTSSRSLLVFDAGGEQVAELWDGDGTDIGTNMIEIGAFSPAADDVRLATATNRSGFVRPFLWDPRSDSRQELRLDGLGGDVIPTAWSPDGSRLVLCQQWQAQLQLYLYAIDDESLSRVDHPPGEVHSTLFSSDGSILTVWENPATPPRLIALDELRGHQQQTVLGVSPCYS